ncbi:MAG: porin, partial [Deltaproteobacteria bacterium]|nr:porin [Deltaproteobacteria bacterium]
TSTTLPRVDIGAPLYFGPVALYPGFIYQRKSVDNPPAAGVDDSVDTMIGSLGLKAGFGPFGFAGEINYGQNWANTRGLIGTAAFNNMAVGLAGATLKNDGSIEDAETYSFWIDVSYKFGPITPHLMYGSMKSKNETVTGADTECKTQMYGISVPIDLAKGFRVRPELMWYDNGDTSTDGAASVDNGKYAIYGVQFQITF